jgi:DNA mismatch repair protein MutL
MLQLAQGFILARSNRGFLVIHPQLAHERILYERFLDATQGSTIPTQQSLFPITIELTPGDAVIMDELVPDLLALGFQLEPFGKHTYVVRGTPADLEAGGEKQLLESILEQYKHFNSEIKFSRREKLVRTMAAQRAIRKNRPLTEKEMKGLVADLFDCRQCNVTVTGSPTYIEFKLDHLDSLFRRQ